MPYPFWRTKREPYWGELEQASVPFVERVRGELRHLREWAETYRDADIWVECRLKPFAPGISAVRLIAHRAGEAGFVAVQRPEAEVVEAVRGVDWTRGVVVWVRIGGTVLRRRRGLA
ncbi:hypothetical protein AO501_23735 [Mycobacterium gordonae]|uniref:Uncharacterized protein n=1 Tax=Mycobacterium gordonae TaxID=1778 RepID=A0A0Q2QDE7_MYCGO|nr:MULTISPECIES: hypothetical protein [Mycobacterium]KQH77725.1 hypothetical protein AO501_23735 [Mycobacterium gordonae]MDP7729622.1 hypothetical protein [Mycobacterium sp. TY813]